MKKGKKRFLGSTIGRIIVGILVLAMIMVIDQSGGLLMLLFLSVVCTFGIGGVVWIGIAYIIGCLLDLIIVGITGQKGDVEVSMKANGDLITYIMDAKKAQLTEAQIKANLLAAGWQKKDVDTAFTKV